MHRLVPAYCTSSLLRARAPVQVPGVDCPDKSDPATIAKMTVQTLDRCLPPAMPGVTFLSGGISEEDSSIYLNEINKLPRKGAFALTFSYSRALQSSCIKIWGGKDDKYKDAQAQLKARLETLEKFKKDEADLMVASDVAARGLDIKGLSHVFNFDVPSNPEDYVHRIGRTGRAGSEGRAFTLATPEDARYLANIVKLIGGEIPPFQVAGVDSVADPAAKTCGRRGNSEGEKSLETKPEGGKGSGKGGGVRRARTRAR